MSIRMVRGKEPIDGDEELAKKQFAKNRNPRKIPCGVCLLFPCFPECMCSRSMHGLDTSSRCNSGTHSGSRLMANEVIPFP
jgi:hypothetical protein